MTTQPNHSDDELDAILKNFLDGVDFTLEMDAEDIPAHDKEFFDRPFTEAKAALQAYIQKKIDEAIEVHDANR